VDARGTAFPPILIGTQPFASLTLHGSVPEHFVWRGEQRRAITQVRKGTRVWSASVEDSSFTAGSSNHNFFEWDAGNGNMGSSEFTYPCLHTLLAGGIAARLAAPLLLWLTRRRAGGWRCSLALPGTHGWTQQTQQVLQLAQATARPPLGAAAMGHVAATATAIIGSGPRRRIGGRGDMPEGALYEGCCGEVVVSNQVSQESNAPICRNARAGRPQVRCPLEARRGFSLFFGAERRTGGGSPRTAERILRVKKKGG